MVVCRLEDFFSSQWDCWIWWSRLFFLVILKELVIQFVTTIYKQGFNKLLVHFVFRVDVDDIGKE